jgi:NAD(P)-dependent dehydrogenase (short-subunit alcohol dehydrogenase family)
MSGTVVITGANGNMGVATVKKFLEEGYRVIAVDNSGSHLEFAAGNPAFELKSVDLSSETEAEKFVREALVKNGQIDCGLLLVGGFAAGDIRTTGGADLRKMYSLNFETAYFLARPLFLHMMEKGSGRLVFIGARPALRPDQGKSLMAYALSKSLLFKLAELLNAEAVGKNVVVSVLAPSTLDTPLNRASMPAADPSHWVKPEEIAGILEFICGGKGSVLRESVYKVYNNA